MFTSVIVFIVRIIIMWCGSICFICLLFDCHTLCVVSLIVFFLLFFAVSLYIMIYVLLTSRNVCTYLMHASLKTIFCVFFVLVSIFSDIILFCTCCFSFVHVLGSFHVSRHSNLMCRCSSFASAFVHISVVFYMMFASFVLYA